jgi:hypothetical protein
VKLIDIHTHIGQLSWKEPHLSAHLTERSQLDRAVGKALTPLGQREMRIQGRL